MMWKLVTAMLWITSWVMLPSHANGFWTPKATSWLLGSFLIGSSLWWNEPTSPSVRNRWWGAWWLVILASFGWHVLRQQLFLPATLAANFQMPWNVWPILPTFCALGSFLAAEAMVRHAEDQTRWTQVAEQLCYVMASIALYGLCQFLYLDPFELGPRAIHGWTQRNALVTTMGNPTLTANFLAMAAPLCLIFKAKRFLIIYLLIMLDLVLARSATSLGAAGLSSLLVLAYRRSWYGLGLLVAAAGLGSWWLVSHDQMSAVLDLGGRWQTWQTGTKIWYEQVPWMGLGLGGIERLTAQGFWSWSSLHNEPLQILVELGLLGGVVFLGWISHLCWRLWHLEKSLLLIGWLGAALTFSLISLTSFPLRLGSHLMVGTIILAALESLTTGGRYARRIPA